MNINRKNKEKSAPATTRFTDEYLKEGTITLVNNSFETEKGVYKILIFKNPDGMIFFVKIKNGVLCEYTNLTTFGGVY